jgi:hypothetical protein
LAITADNLDQVFTFHQWSPEQVAKGNAIRAAAKEFAKAILASAPTEPLSQRGSLVDLAQRRREQALEMVSDTVMKANAAITFEAAVLMPIAPELAHSERIAAPATT